MKRFSNHPVLFLLGLLGVAAVVIGELAGVLSLGEPVCRGKPLSDWMENLNGPDRNQAQIALSEIGSKGVPFLLQKLHRDVSFYERVLRTTWNLAPGWARKKLPPPLARDGLLIYRVGCALAQLGPTAVPGLTAALGDHDDAVRLAAVNAIASIGSGAHAAIPRLTNLLSNLDPWNRENVVVSFTTYGREETEEVLLALSHPGPTKAVAAWTLGRIGPEAHGAVVELTRMLSDKDADARQQAAIAMWRISGLTNGLDILVSALKTSSDNVRCCRVLTALGEMGPLARPAVPSILTLLNNRPQSATVPDLSRIGREALVKIQSEGAVLEAGHQP